MERLFPSLPGMTNYRAMRLSAGTKRFFSTRSDSPWTPETFPHFAERSRTSTKASAGPYISCNWDNLVGFTGGSDTLSYQKMNAILRCAVAAVLAAMATGARVSAEPRVALTVRLYNTSGIPAPALLAARDAIESTFEDSGLDLIVRPCGRGSQSSVDVDSCSEPLKPLEMVVRIIDAPLLDRTLHPDACGMAYVIKETDRGWLATAYSDRIASASVRVGVDAGTLLGLVISHELGHLLLGSGYHGWSGVMRADWSEELLNGSREPWRFSALEAARMRSRQF